MKKSLSFLLFLLITGVLYYSCQSSTTENETGSADHIKQVTAGIDNAALINADANQGDWLSHGRNYQEDRYSKLDQISKENVGSLDLAWAKELGISKGLQATPIVVDGIMFFSGPFNQVWAFDARTGKQIWYLDPQFNHDKNIDLCCGFTNRGLAVYKGNLYMGMLDGRLLSIDAATGDINWDVLTIPENSTYSITGAPRIVKGNVIIGNGGAEIGARGYVTAYDAESGKQQWRFYTVPGDPNKPYEHPDLEEAAKTWSGNEYWKQGGGGTAWDAMAYDPDLDLLYIGVGNGAHWDREWRSPGGGDNLYLSSIVALNPNDGSYVWHYQTTPGDSWDYTATQHLVLADMEIAGKERKVIMQAPKNGYFYVIDRTNGEYISANNFVYQNWTTGMDENGRPIEAEGARYLDGKSHWIAPSSHGGHNWPPMSYNHETGLVYIPTAKQSEPFVRTKSANDPGALGGGFNANVSLNNKLYWPAEMDANPEAPIPMTQSGRLVAWNPVTQEEAWGIDQVGIYNGGLLSTSTGLLMQGDAQGMFSIRDASNGDVLRQFDLRSGIVGSPITYLVDGEQYITILVGWGGYMAKLHKHVPRIHQGTIYTFKLNGDGAFPEKLPPHEQPLTTIRDGAGPEQIGNGFNVFSRFCISCHGLPGTGHTSTPDLARSTNSIFENYNEIIIKGTLKELGMPAMEGLITEDEITDLKSYIFYSAKAVEEGMDPTAYLTSVAEMQYAADQAALIKD